MDIEEFISRWTAREGGAERANYQMFLSELCDVLGVRRPDPAGAQRELNDYVFERAVRPREGGPTKNPKRIDLYKRDAFIVEAKQSRLPGKKNAIPGHQPNTTDEPDRLGKRSIARDWDVMMQNARRQAEAYVFLLDTTHKAPPFIIACDVGHCLELYADFSGTGRAYSQFPDRKGFRVYMEDLRAPAVRELLSTIWTDPLSLDPARTTARVTKDIARRLAQVSKALEERGHNPETVAHFLMRCLFTMFAEDVDLLPSDSFKSMLAKSVDDPLHFKHRLQALWQQMEKGEEYSHVIEARVRHFNGGLFKETTVFELQREEIGELLAAARHRWTDVDPAIFGTLLEQALDKKERKRLGAHYTPRSYVQRLVEVVIMEPLRADWQAALTKAEQAKEDGNDKQATALVRAFHRRLCDTRVLDPACGTGNFLYVALELMKKLEGEALETLAKLGEPENLGLDRDTVDPHQFLGLELNPRAAAIAELVVWIGYLQQHYRTRSGHPSEPILKAFKNINFGKREGYDAVLVWDGYPTAAEASDGHAHKSHPNPRRPSWPEAEFIVGNPPFVAGQDMRVEFGSDYTEALWAAHSQMNDSADFVMYWWDRAADTITRAKSATRRFGFVTTNSISQVFQRRTVARWLSAKRAVSVVWAIDNHPWTQATTDAAAVRIAMTVAETGTSDGRLLQIVHEAELDSDQPIVEFSETRGKINSDLTIGPDVTRMRKLRSNDGLSHDGVKLHGKGFSITEDKAKELGSETRPGLKEHIRRYGNGRNMRSGSLKYVIDLFGLSEVTVRMNYPEVYEYLLERVRYDLGDDGKPKINKKGQKTGREWNNRPTYRNNWWIFGEPRAELRPALLGLTRYVGTVDTSPNRIFEFIDSDILVDDGVVVIAMDSGEDLAILSSRIHVLFSLRAGGWLGVGDDPRYNKSLVFDPFPFPELDNEIRIALRKIGNELDATRKQILSDNPDLTLTGIYNVLEKVRGDTKLTEDEELLKAKARVLTLKEIHDQLDSLVETAYGWPAHMAENEILERLVALNAERSKEEAVGQIRWLRPVYQVPLFARAAAAKTGELDLGEGITEVDTTLPSFPTDRYEQPLAIEAVLLSTGRPMDAAELARSFRRGGKRIEQRVTQVLTTLTRYGRVTLVDGARYAARKAA